MYKDLVARQEQASSRAVSPGMSTADRFPSLSKKTDDDMQHEHRRNVAVANVNMTTNSLDAALDAANESKQATPHCHDERGGSVRAADVDGGTLFPRPRAMPQQSPPPTPLRTPARPDDDDAVAHGQLSLLPPVMRLPEDDDSDSPLGGSITPAPPPMTRDGRPSSDRRPSLFQARRRSSRNSGCRFFARRPSETRPFGRGRPRSRARPPRERAHDEAPR